MLASGILPISYIDMKQAKMLVRKLLKAVGYEGGWVEIFRTEFKQI